VTATINAAASGDLVNTAVVTPPGSVVNLGTACTSAGSQFTQGTGACSATDTDIPALGIGGGHFDLDIYYRPITIKNGVTTLGDYKNQKHQHKYDDKWDVTGVNGLAPSDASFNLLPGLQTGQQFKVLVMNQVLNPAAFLAVGPGDAQTSVQFYGGLADATPGTIAAVLAALPTYTRPASPFVYNPSDLNQFRLIINLPETAFNSFNWWGLGDVRSGVIPTQTGCVNSITNSTTGATGSKTGPNGERFDGALTIQLIKPDTTAAMLEQNNTNAAMTDAERAQWGWRVKAANFSQVLAEYTMFWHHPNGKCYADAGWVKNPPLDTSAPGNPTARPAGSADPQAPIPPNPPVVL
jgi:hypothetical protein